jgi:hypothetical protein
MRLIFMAGRSSLRPTELVISIDNISIDKLSTFADNLYGAITGYVSKFGINEPSPRARALWYNGTQKASEVKFLSYSDMFAELVDRLHAITRMPGRDERYPLFEQIYADKLAKQGFEISLQDCMAQSGEYDALPAADKAKVDKLCAELAQAVRESEFCKALQVFIDGVICLLPVEKRNSQEAVEHWRYDLLNRVFKEFEAVSSDKTMLEVALDDGGIIPDGDGRLQLLRRMLKGNNWLTSSLDTKSIKKYQQQKEQAPAGATAESVDIPDNTRLSKAMKSFSSGEESAQANDTRSKVRNSSGKVKRGWLGIRQDYKEVVYKPENRMFTGTEIKPVFDDEVQLTELLNLIELIKALIDSGEKDKNSHPVGDFYVRLSPYGSENSANRLVIIQATVEALKAKNSRLAKLNYVPCQETKLRLAGKMSQISSWRKILLALDHEHNDLLSMDKTFLDKDVIKKRFQPLNPLPADKSSALEVKVTKLMEKQPGFVARVWQMFSRGGKRIGNSASRVWRRTAAGVGNFVSRVGEGIGNFASPVWQSIAAGVGNFVSRVSRGIGNFASRAWQSTARVRNFVSEQLGSLARYISTFVFFIFVTMIFAPLYYVLRHPVESLDNVRNAVRSGVNALARGLGISDQAEVVDAEELDIELDTDTESDSDSDSEDDNFGNKRVPPVVIDSEDDDFDVKGVSPAGSPAASPVGAFGFFPSTPSAEPASSASNSLSDVRPSLQLRLETIRLDEVKQIVKRLLTDNKVQESVTTLRRCKPEGEPSDNNVLENIIAGVIMKKIQQNNSSVNITRAFNSDEGISYQVIKEKLSGKGLDIWKWQQPKQQAVTELMNTIWGKFKQSLEKQSLSSLNDFRDALGDKGKKASVGQSGQSPAPQNSPRPRS